VVLLNLGGPGSPDDVRPFLYNLFSDRLIIRLGPAFMQKPIAWLIARRRAPKSRAYYEKIGGGSPLTVITQGQAASLEKRLREHGEFRTYVGMRYWRPSIDEAVGQAVSDGAERVMALSLYPQYSIATTGSSEKAFDEAVRRHGVGATAAVPPWYVHPLYIDALADLLEKALLGLDGAHVLFSAHSLPRKFIDEGDPYDEHVRATIEALMARFDRPWSLGYQSRSGPVEWLGPPIEEVIARLGREGVREAVVVPVSFVSDHIETLYEIDMFYKDVAREAGIRLARTESLNIHPMFIRALEDLVLTAARKEGWL
jgi:ferrochelatase